ncbi:Bifunctional TH2 protein, mitochondrial, partial [Linum perenne]
NSQSPKFALSPLPLITTLSLCFSLSSPSVRACSFVGCASPPPSKKPSQNPTPLPAPPPPADPPLSKLRSLRRSSSISPPPPRAMAIPPKLLSSTTSSILSSATSLGNISSERGLAAKLWIKFRRELHFAMQSPFLVCLAAGKLEMDAFRHFVAQDLHFLKAFAHAYELAEECADDDEAKLAIADLRRAVVEALKKHNSVVLEWGIESPKEVAADSATVKYTDFLLATASGKVEGVKGPGKLATPFERTKIAAYILGAVSPYMRLYAFLGKELQELVDSNDDSHPYKKWIEYYSCDKFQVSAFQTEDLLEKLSVCLTGEELDVIEKLYHQGMKHETEFFNAQPLKQPTVVPLTKVHNPDEDRLLIFSDFDLTCTVVDSSAILAEIAIVTAPKSDPPQPENQISIQKSMNSALKAFYPLKKFESRANSRVIESGVLKGLNLEDIKRAGERLLLQDGCSSFFQKIAGNGKLNANVNVLSYCWCADLIRSAFKSGGLGDVSVHANELTFKESISTGEIVNKVQSPMDKAEAFSNILKSYGDDKRNFTVYIGDSVGDLLCLLQADVGIVIGSSSSLRKVGRQFGVSFVPLFSGVLQKQKECVEGSCSMGKSLSGTLYTVSSWAEIHALVLGW